MRKKWMPAAVREAKARERLSPARDEKVNEHLDNAESVCFCHWQL